ncbi:hypothetical protein [Streptomyces sp. NPDC090036]|uniref:hypothetical protein n=1 Tax=Streptomyces sp. NPDC090036 TaxID=3365926 RepID=UPI0037F717EA
MGLLLIVSAGMFGALFTATFHLQDVEGLDPLATGVRVLPLTAARRSGSRSPRVPGCAALRWWPWPRWPP